MIEHVAIVGGGFSGTLLAINLLRHDGPRATLIERDPTPGAGLAFGAAHPGHLLNVRAGNMSALPDDPGHFVRWLAAIGIEDAATRFVPRLMYGRYLKQLLDESCAGAPSRLTTRRGRAVDVVRNDRDLTLCFDDGTEMSADAAVLAIGNLPPHDPPPFDAVALGRDLYRADPWEPGLAEGLRDDATVLILGTGLTMIDVVLSLEAQGFRGRMVAMSRRGQVPHVHAPVPPPRAIEERPPARASALVRFVRERAAAEGWRGAVDALRPITQTLWRGADAANRARFLRHLRPYWDIHRHRLAPEVAGRLEELRGSGRLRIVAAKPQELRNVGDRLEVDYRPRCAEAAKSLSVDRVVNCTGPQADLLRSEDPLLRALLAQRAIRPDALRIGIDVDYQSQVIDAAGRSDERLFAVGPMTRGAFWEIVAVPDIRVQSWELARRLSHARWVGGEGL